MHRFAHRIVRGTYYTEGQLADTVIQHGTGGVAVEAEAVVH